MRFPWFAALAVLAACQVNDPSLSTTEQDLTGVIFSPPSPQDVGSVQVGSSSAPFGIQINPSGLYEVSYTINSITGCSDFSIDAPGLPAEIHKTCISTCVGCVPAFAPPVCDLWEIVGYDFSTTFRPATPNASSCAIQIDVTGLGLKTYTISGTGTLPPIDIDVNPVSVAFGDVRRNTASSPATINVRNAGGQAISVTGTTLSTGYAITSGPTGAFSVAVGATQQIGITCNPTVTGSLPGTFRVSSNDPATPVSTVALSCNGIDSALDVTPSPAAVPTTRVGEPAQRTVQLSNTGTAPMTIQSATLVGTGLTATGLPAANSMIAAGASVTATITFAAGAPGDVAGMLTVTYDGGQVRSIPISAKALATSMSLSPDGEIDLGPVCVGQSTARDVAVSANAEGGFKLVSVSTLAAPFSVVAPPLPAVLLGSGANTKTLAISIAPTAVGPATSSLTVTTDIPGGMPRTLELKAEGLTAGVSATPAELDLGPTAVNSTTIGQEVELTNCSSTAAVLSNPRLEGTDAGDFAIVQQPSLMVAANGSAKWLIVAQPHSVGSKSAMFSVDHDGGTATVLLNADGTGDPVGTDPGTTDVSSYYTCSSGGSSGSWPVVLVLGLLFIVPRRRRA
ncbi:MAG: choice-of-anchor D domain-containing protein [Myxococcales bacterium]|nr:choice-of-anchor D domain-containing protein [Myxococcales bacterium]